MVRHIRKYVQACDVCQHKKDLQRQLAGKLMPLPIPAEAWEVVSMDGGTHLPKTEKRHTAIFVVVDKFTKICQLAPCRDTDDAEATAVLFKDNCFRFHGWPSKAVSDRGPEFTNKFAVVLVKSLGTEHCKSTSYHPQSNGQTERMNRVLVDMLRHFVNPRQDCCQFLIRNQRLIPGEHSGYAVLLDLWQPPQGAI